MNFYRVVCVFLLTIFAPHGLLAEDSVSLKLPDTVAGKRLQGFFDAYAAGTDDAIRSMEREHRVAGTTDIETRVALARKFRSSWGVLTPKLILFEQEHSLVVLAKSTGESEWYRCEVLLEAKEPYKMQGVAVTKAFGPKFHFQNMGGERLEDAVEKFRQAVDLPALAIGTISGDHIEVAVAGVRSVNSPVPVELQDRFRLGSVSKSITGLVVAKLIDRGLLDWDAKLGELLADINVRPEFRDVTIEQLMQNRGGVPFYPETKLFKSDAGGSAVAQRAAFAAKVLSQAPVNKPGTAYQYSNAGWSIVGHIAERVAKRPWEELVQVEIFDPLQMVNAGVGWPATVARPNQPLGHTLVDDTLSPQPIDTERYPFAVGPAGDVHCSIEDFARYAQAHLKTLRGVDGILRPATMRRLHTPAKRTGATDTPYAGGWLSLIHI